jgi:asparagine synthase (glutamine-hydrolysing)
VGIGVRRLSVIDLKSGDQPIHNEDSSLWIVFNGEIYNYKTLRETALKAGHRFYTESDTEVILHLYEMYGTAAIGMLDGMFAMCIWDKIRDCMLLARDRIGEKPLYYFKGPHEFVFASEPKAILAYPGFVPEVDHHSLEMYLVLGYVPSPWSLYQCMSKLAPGSFILVQSDGTATTSSYYDSRSEDSRRSVDGLEAVSDALKVAVQSRLVSDVPLGVLLSGGVDSSLVASFMTEAIGTEAVNAFTIGFKDSVFDESEHALKVARHLGIETNLTTFNESDVLSHVREALTLLDEPIADPSVIPTYLVSLAASEKVKVVLTGDGGDELFGGYPKYRIHLWLEIYDGLPSYAKRLLSPLMQGLPEKLVGQKGKRVLSTLSYTAEERNMLWISPFLPSELKKLLINEPNFSIAELNAFPTGKSGTDPVRIAMKNDLRYALGDLFLSKVDRASMACSLESRAPFLAPDVLEAASRLPTSDNIGFFKTKKLLKEIALNRLPREIVVRKKQGFGIPISLWLRGPLKEFATSMLSEKRIETSSLFHYEQIRQLLDEHFSRAKDNSAKIWTLLVFQVWSERWLRGTKAG